MQWIPIMMGDAWSTPSYPRPRPGPRNIMLKVRNSLIGSLWFRGGKHRVDLKAMDKKPIYVIIWINQNIPKTVVEEIPHFNYYCDYYHVKFRTREDLMAFKLRWV